MDPPKRDAHSSSEITEASENVVPETEIKEVTATKEDAKKIVEKLEDSPIIVLTGAAGVGKTWLANAVSEYAEKKHCTGTIWISLDQKHDEESLHAEIARQFSLLDNADEWDAEEEENAEEKKKDEEEETPEKGQVEDPIIAKRRKKMEDVILKIKERIEEKSGVLQEEKDKEKQGQTEGQKGSEIHKYLLWVLDEGFKMQENDGMEAHLCLLKGRIWKWGNSKILITTGRPRGEQILAKPLKAGNNMVSGEPYTTLDIKVQPLSCKEASKLVADRRTKYKKVPHSTVKYLGKAIEEQKKKETFLPADVIVILGALNCKAEQHQNAHLHKLEEALKEVIDRLIARDDEVKLEEALKLVIDRLIAGDNLLKGLPDALEALQGDQTPGKPLSGKEASQLVANSRKKYKEVPDSTLKYLCKAIVEQKKEKLDDVDVILGALNCIAEQYQNAHLPKLEEALKEVIDGLIAGEDLVKRMLLTALEALQGDQKMVDCFWHAWEFFQARRGAVHYNELVTHWILEGCFDPVEHLEKAYTKGHGVMMKLVDYGMLRIQEDNGMFMEGLELKNIKDERRRGISTTAKLGMAPMLKWKGFGRVAPADGMIKTLRLGEKEDLVSTLLVDGSCIRKKTPKELFLETHKLQVLGVFDSMLTAPPPEPPLEPNYKELHILVLRRCYLLKNLSHINRLDTLTALEMSGATFLKEIPEKIFESATQLQSLNLSDTGVELLPKSLSELTQLRRLILKRCLNLLNLPPVRKLKKLQVLDLSECYSLERLGDMCFQSLEELEILDLSYTRIQRMPIINSLPKLSQLLLKGCNNLGAMRKLQKLIALKYLDISGVTKIREIHEEFLNGTENIEEVDLSGTGIQVLPNFGKEIRVLKLRDCSKLDVLPKIKSNSLELLDLSNASSLQTIEDQFFTHLTNLQSLNLSNTNVEKLPALNLLNKLETLLLEGCSSLEQLPEMKELSSLKKLKLKGCKTLKSLPSLKDLVSLEEMDLSGCEALPEVPTDCFDHLKRLQKLNLSETQIKRLPSLDGSRNLQALVLRNCKNLESFPDLAPVSKLVELDLLGTSLEDVKAQSLNHLTQLQIMRLQKITVEDFLAISFRSNLKELSLNSWSDFTEAAWVALEGLEVLELSDDTAESLPSLDSLIRLLKLSVRGAKLNKLPSLGSLTHLETLDLSGDGIEKLPDGISKLLNLKHLHVPHLKLIQDFGWTEINNPPRYLDWQEWEGREYSCLDGGKPYVLVQGTNLFKRLKDNDQLTKASKLFKEINVSVHSSSKMHMKEAESNRGTWYDIHSKIRKFQHGAQDGLFLEIQGFDEYPVEAIEVLKEAEYVSLVDNKFLKNISDENLKSMKGCCLDRCTEVKRIYKEPDTLVKSERKLKFAENLEILQISGLLNLRSFYDGGKEQCFKKLRELNIDSCPSLETVFSSEQILDQLQTIHIKSCGSLKTVFGQSQASDKFASASKLKQLYIHHCPMLETVYSSPQLPEELNRVEIKSCAKLQRVFGTKDSSTTAVLKVHTMHLSNLPEFTTVGVELLNYEPVIDNCPKWKSETIPGETGEITAAQ